MSELQGSNDGLFKYNGKPLPNFPKGKIMPARGLNDHEVARYSKKVKECNREEIYSLISSLCTALELPASFFPSDSDKEILITLIRSELKNETPKIIWKAFLDAINGKFTIDLKTYGVFSFAYVSRVVKAYKDYVISNRFIKELPDAPKEEKTPEQIHQDGLAALKRNAKNILDQINKGVNLGSIWIQPSLYNLLKANNLIKPSKWVRLKEYETIQEQCAGEYMKLKPKKDIFEQITDDAKRNDGMKMAVIYTIQALIKEYANSEIIEIIDGLKWDQ